MGDGEERDEAFLDAVALLPESRQYAVRSTTSSWGNQYAEFSEGVIQLAYEIWLLRANRNGARTARLLEEELSDWMDEFPSARLINKWKHMFDWVAKAEDDIKSVAPMLNERHFLRLFSLTEEAEELYAQIISGDHPLLNSFDPHASKKLDVMFKAAQDLLKLRGLGTAGGYAPPAIPHATVRLDEQNDKTPAQIAAALRELILEEKQHMGKKKDNR